jgi:hypothetical protein
MTTTDHSTPTQLPPSAGAATAETTATAGRPSPTRSAPVARTSTGGGTGNGRSTGTGTGAGAAPTLLPPPRSTGTGTATTSAAATATVWQNDKAIVATWSDAGPRNAWALVDGLGWRKIFDGSDGAFLALTLLATQARQTGHHVNYREDDQVVKEIYLW